MCKKMANLQNLFSIHPETPPLIGDMLESWRLDWVNNYLTISRFAEANGVSEEIAATVLKLAEQYRLEGHPDA